MRPSPTVLLVDDEVLITEMVADALADSGFPVVVANDGASALRVIEDAGTTVAVLVTDVNMGAGDDGWLVARRAREICPDLPVVYTTGGAGADWAAHGVAGSILVVKPFTMPALIAAMAALLDRDVAGAD